MTTDQKKELEEKIEKEAEDYRYNAWEYIQGTKSPALLEFVVRRAIEMSDVLRPDEIVIALIKELE